MGFTNFLKAVGLGAGLFGLIGAAFGAAFYMDSDKETRENWDAPLYTTFSDSGETGKQENSSEPAVCEKVYDYTAHCESCECDQPAEISDMRAQRVRYRGRTFSVKLAEARCSVCGEKVTIPELDQWNRKRIVDYYAQFYYRKGEEPPIPGLSEKPAEPDAQTIEVEADPDSPVTITQEVKVYPAKEK